MSITGKSNNSTEIREDYLEVDNPIPGQNFVCLSFVSPEKILKQKNTFYVRHFLNFYSKMNDVERKRYNIVEHYDNFIYSNKKKLNEQFDKENEFKTSVRGVKVRGVFRTQKEASIRAEVLQRMDDVHHIFVGQVGYWLPWDPEADHLENQEYQNDELNKLMKKYKENQMHKDMHYQKEMADKKKEIMKEKLKKEEEAKKNTTQETTQDTTQETTQDTTQETTQDTTNENNLLNTLQEDDPWMKRKKALNQPIVDIEESNIKEI